MTDLFANRTPREKLLLASLAALALLWVAITQVWQPLHSLRQDIAARIPRIERALAEMQANPTPQTTGTDPRTTPALLTDAADTFGLTITRLQPQGTQVLVTLEDAPFDTVLLWTQSLLQEGGLRLTQLTLTRRTAPGIVATTLTVER